MHKLTLFTSLATALLLVGMTLAGCQQSQTWKTVVNAPLPGRGDPGQSRAYATTLQAILRAQKVENKKVTFRYSLPIHGVRIDFRRTAVIYRDVETPDYPWWFASSFSSTPVWLPNTPMEQQIAFAARRQPILIEEVDDGSGIKASEEELQKFERLHGTPFDPASALDREKMADIRRAEKPELGR